MSDALVTPVCNHSPPHGDAQSIAPAGRATSEEVSLAVVAAGVAHVGTVGVGLDTDRDHGETERARERDRAVRDPPACRVAAGVADEAPREPELVESVLDDLVDLALAVDAAEHGPNADLAQGAKRALDRARRSSHERVRDLDAQIRRARSRGRR